MKKYTLTLGISLLLCLGATAGPVNPQTAATVAGAFWRGAVPTKAAATLVDRSAEWAYDGIYLFVNPDGGFVLVAADDNATPILGYSPTAPFDPARLPLPLQEWLQGYQQQIEWLRAHETSPYPAAAAQWEALRQGQGPKSDGAKSVGPLLTTFWDQDYPYNELCPGNTVTGCAATAQAQLMRFWNYPAFGIGSHTYTHNTYGTLSADFSHTLYDWEHMPEQPLPYSPQQERTAVATLMYHVGISLDMDYGTAAQGGSSALGLVGMPGYASIDNSLIDYFGYNPDMQVIFKDYGFTNDTWREALIGELDQGHPVLYAGSALQGGHGFVCDGYDDRQYMHFNFGWSGVGDGYYPVDSISPGVGGAGGNGTYTFNLNNAALLGAVPAHSMRTSDTLFNFTGNGGTDSLLFCINENSDDLWSVSSDADWLTVQEASFEHAGWVRFSADTLVEGERSATLTFAQGGDTLTVRVVQASFNPDDACPLTVVMQATHGDGWQNGACLTLQSALGYIFGTASLNGSALDSVVIPVASHDVYAVFHHGGGTDRYINYSIRNQYGETLVEVRYAYRNGGTDFIDEPCAHVGIDEHSLPADQWTVWPNPADQVLHIDADDLQHVEILDVSGRRVLDSGRSTINIGQLPAGPYFVRITTAATTGVKRIVKR